MIRQSYEMHSPNANIPDQSMERSANNAKKQGTIICNHAPCRHLSPLLLKIFDETIDALHLLRDVNALWAM